MTFLAAGIATRKSPRPAGRWSSRRIDVLSGASRLTAIRCGAGFSQAVSGERKASGVPFVVEEADESESGYGSNSTTRPRRRRFREPPRSGRTADALFADTIRLVDRDRTATADRNVRTVSRSAAARIRRESLARSHDDRRRRDEIRGDGTNGAFRNITSSPTEVPRWRQETPPSRISTPGTRSSERSCPVE